MKDERNNFLRPYETALVRYLTSGRKACLKPALRLGRRAVLLKLETLDLALVHEQALLSQVLSSPDADARARIIKRARLFFSEAIVPMEETHRSAMESVVELNRLNRSLNLRTQALSASNAQLKKEIARRQVVEATLLKNERQASRLLEQSRGLQSQLQYLSRRILSAQEEERKRISRELHDVIAQMLTGINLRLATLKTDATLSAKGLGRKISHTQKLVERSVNVVHRFARELRPTVLDDLGLIPALHSFVKNFSSEAGIPVTLTAFAGVEKLSDAKRTVLYRVAHETLANVSRHAHASQAKVVIRKLPTAVLMEISDDGKGFIQKNVPSGRQRMRLGLLGIRERVEMVGGRLTINSVPGRGTTVRAEIPFKNSNRKDGRS